jgi:hypothetical protein
VVDERPDKMAIGLTMASHRPVFVIARGDLSDDAQLFLNSTIHFSKSDSFSVVMVIKKFWVTSNLDNEIEREIQNTGVDTSTRKISSLLARIEFYLKKGPDHFILYRFDTTITRNLYVANDASALVEQGLISSLYKLKEMDSKFQSISKTKRKFSMEEIEVHVRKQFDMPVLRDSVLNRGVYFSFDEFKNNSPGLKDFEVEKDKLIDLIFIKQANGTQVPVREAWGYCDGKDLYVKSMDNYFLLQREGNAFYVYGAKEFKHKKIAREFPKSNDSASANNEMVNYKNGLQKTSKRHLSLELKGYELDLDNGELN